MLFRQDYAAVIKEAAEALVELEYHLDIYSDEFFYTCLEFRFETLLENEENVENIPDTMYVVSLQDFFAPAQHCINILSFRVKQEKIHHEFLPRLWSPSVETFVASIQHDVRKFVCSEEVIPRLDGENEHQFMLRSLQYQYHLMLMG